MWHAEHRTCAGTTFAWRDRTLSKTATDEVCVADISMSLTGCREGLGGRATVIGPCFRTYTMSGQTRIQGICLTLTNSSTCL